MGQVALALGDTWYSDNCINCGIAYSFPASFIRERKRDGKNFYCPNGHPMHYPGETDEEKIKRLKKEKADAIERGERRVKFERNMRQAAEREALTQKQQRGKLRKRLERVGKGVCPKCNRSFANLARHMAGQHKGHA